MPDAQTQLVSKMYGSRSEEADGDATGGPAAPARPDPPLLIGGLTPEDVGQMSHVGVDFLTVTVPDQTARDLMAESMPHEDGYGRPGFAKSEQRLVMGGKGWRRWEPHQVSEAWGRAYESWEFSGHAAWWPSRFLRERECRPSRIDIAWDFSVDAGYMSDDFAAAVKPWCEAQRITMGHSGHAGIDTQYIGSRKSDRMVRVYRKDLQDAVLAEILGPTLRVELVLKGDHAAAFWQVWKLAGSEDEAWPAAAAVLQYMCGLAISPGEMPQLEVPECKDQAQLVLAFLEQNCATVTALVAAGVPVVDLCREASEGSSKRTKIRQTQRVLELRRQGVEQVVQLVRDVMQGKQLKRRSA